MTRLRKALAESGQTARALSEATGFSYAAVHNYLRGTRTPPADFLTGAASFFGVPVGYLHGWDREIHEVLGTETLADARFVEFALETFPDFAPAEEQAFRSYLARWLGADPLPTLDERIARMRELAAMLEAPLAKFGTELRGRRRTDYVVAMLLALGLAMPERN